MATFFISYNQADRAWAEWVAWQLEENGHSTVIQAWDFRPGSNFVLEMNEAASKADRTIAVLSPSYLASLYTQPEWAAAFARDPGGEQRILLPVRVRECDLRGLLPQIVYVDLVGQQEETARGLLLDALKDRAKPAAPPAFPGFQNSLLETPHSVPEPRRFPGKLPVVWNVPPRNPFFGGRTELLEQLHSELSQHGRAALCGLGGVGKTQIAAEYAYQHSHEYSAVLWTPSPSELELSSGYAAIAAVLDLAEKDTQEPEQIVRAVKRWLERNENWLLIFDNADRQELLAPFLPNQWRGHILLSSRAQVFDMLGIARPLEIGEMPPEEALQFLIQRAGREGINEEERTAASQLVDELGGFPLALDQAGAYILEKKARFRDYLTSYSRRRLGMLKLPWVSTANYPASVVTVLTLSLGKVVQESATAADLLRFSSFLSPDGIPLELIVRGAAELGEAVSTQLKGVEEDPLLLDEALELLTRYSLIRRDVEAGTYGIHRLVQEVMRDSMTGTARSEWVQRTVRAVNRAFTSADYADWPHCVPLLPHASACADFLRDEEALPSPEAGALLWKAGICLRDRGQYQDAERLLRGSLVIRERLLQGLGNEEGSSPEDRAGAQLNLAGTQNVLASVFRRQAKYEDAEPLYVQARCLREQARGPEHPDVAAILNNLGNLYYDQQRYTEAEQLHRQAVAIWEKASGPEHPLVAMSHTNRANALRDLRQWEEAERLYHRALAIREKLPEPDYLGIADTLNSRGILHLRRNEYAQAEQDYQRALAIWENEFGAQHHYVGSAHNNLAELRLAQGRAAEALQEYEQARDILEAALGPKHPQMAEVLHGLAELQARKGSREAATEYARRAYRIREAHLGPEHEDTIRTRELLREIEEGKITHERAGAAPDGIPAASTPVGGGSGRWPGDSR